MFFAIRIYFRTFEFLASLSIFYLKIYKKRFTIRKTIKMSIIKVIIPMLLTRERNLYPISEIEVFFSSIPIV